jgi:hypothetical protein
MPRKRILPCSSLLTPPILVWRDSYPEDVTSEAEEEVAGQATEEAAEEEGNDGGAEEEEQDGGIWAEEE